jgi:hypothetical protein
MTKTATTTAVRLACGICDRTANAYTTCCEPRLWACADHRRVVYREHRRHLPGCGCTQRMLSCHQTHAPRWRHLCRCGSEQIVVFVAAAYDYAPTFGFCGEHAQPYLPEGCSGDLVDPPVVVGEVTVEVVAGKR